MARSELSNMDIVLVALFRLGGVDQKIHTEKIAIECFKLAPKRFSWRLSEYSDHPDKEPVRISLMDAAKEKYGKLATGRSGAGIAKKDLDGWALTVSGAEWILKNRKRIELELNIFGAGTTRTDAQRALKKYYQDPAFKKFLNTSSADDITYYEFTDFLNCTPDANQEVIQKRFERFVTQATFLEDQKLKEFAVTCRKKFLKDSENLQQAMEEHKDETRKA